MPWWIQHNIDQPRYRPGLPDAYPVGTPVFQTDPPPGPGTWTSYPSTAAIDAARAALEPERLSIITGEREIQNGILPFVRTIDLRREPTRDLVTGPLRLGGWRWSVNAQKSSVFRLVQGIGLEITGDGTGIPGLRSGPHIRVLPGQLPGDLPPSAARWALEMLWSSPSPRSGPPWCCALGLVSPIGGNVDDYRGWSSRLGWGGTTRFCAWFTNGFGADDSLVVDLAALGPWCIAGDDRLVRTYLGPPNSTTWPQLQQWRRASSGALNYTRDEIVGPTDPGILDCSPAVGLSSENVACNATIRVHALRLRVF